MARDVALAVGNLFGPMETSCYINNNSYFAHSEQVLLTMLFDPEKKIRQKGARLIIAARMRAAKSKKKSVRPFLKPKINMAVKSYVDFMNLINPKTIFSPPLLRDISDEEIWKQVENPYHLYDGFSDYPSNSQCVGPRGAPLGSLRQGHSFKLWYD